MKLAYALSLLASVTAVAAEDWTVTSLSTTSYSTDLLVVDATITSTSGCGLYNAHCTTQWYEGSEPVNEWIPCTVTTNFDDAWNGFAFQLYPDFTIGDFEISFQQNYTACSGYAYTADAAEPLHVSNSTSNSTYTCGSVHASGSGYDLQTCSVRNNATTYAVASGKHNPLDSSAPVVLSFPVLERTVFGDNVYVVGNISELGNWDPYNAAGLSAAEYTDDNNLWNGAYVMGSSSGDFINNIIVDSGTTFEFKYILWTKNGTLIWECGENRVFSVIDDRTNQATVGDNPDVFRCGDH